MVARNLALVKRFAGTCRFGFGSGRSGALGGRAASQWEKNMWEHFGGGRGTRYPGRESGGWSGSAPHGVIPGGFFFAGTLPGKGREDAAQKKGRGNKKRTTAVGKKKGKPARRR